MDKEDNNISQRLVSLNFKPSKDKNIQYRIDRTFTKNEFVVIQIIDTQNKFSEILLYKNLALADIVFNKNSLQNEHLIAKFTDSAEGWSLAIHCCNKLPEGNLSNNIYTNGIMLAPNGDIMCRCGKDRIKWYLKKGLAQLESYDPPTIRLNFEPEAYGKINDPYYLQEIKNQCVICGAVQDLSKHHVIPYCFRKFFPKEVKENSSHDILLLCRDHHNKYEKEADQLKKELARKYKCDFSGTLKIDLNLKKTKDAAIALLKKNNKMPASTIRKFKQRIKKHYKRQKFSAKDLESAAKIKYRVKNEDHLAYGEHVIRSIGSLNDFMIMWRKHFVELMSPKFLPEYWDINKKITIN